MVVGCMVELKVVNRRAKEVGHKEVVRCRGVLGHREVVDCTEVVNYKEVDFLVETLWLIKINI